MEESADLSCFDDMTEGIRLGLQTAALEAQDAVGQGVGYCIGLCASLLADDVLADDLHKVGKGHDRTADHEIILAFLVLAPQVLGMAVAEADGLAHLLCHTDLLACAVDKLELAVREEYGEGDAWEASSCTEVENTGARTETDDFGYGEGVKYMVLIELVDVLAGYDVDFRIPFVVKCVKCLYLLLLTGGEVGEVFEDDVCWHGNQCSKDVFRSFSRAGMPMVSSMLPRE